MLSRGVREEYNRQRSVFGDVQLFVESHDILEGSEGGRTVNEKNTMGPSQVTEQPRSITIELIGGMNSYPQHSRNISPGLSIISSKRIRLSANLMAF